MLQRAMGALALLGGALLAGSLPGTGRERVQRRPRATRPRRPRTASAPASGATPAASSVPGATEPARVQPPTAQGRRARPRSSSVLDALDHHRQGTMSVPREDGRMLRLLAEAVGAKNGRRDRHVQRLLRPLVQPGPGQDRRPSHHLRHRPGPVRAGQGQLQEGGRRGHGSPRSWATPTTRWRGSRTRSTSCSSTPTRQGYLDYLTKLAAPGPPRRPDPGPQHGEPAARPRLRQGDHHQPRARDPVREHARPGPGNHAQEAVRLSHAPAIVGAIQDPIRSSIAQSAS